jgi:pimeloyl-ACP methyl ester carboxylesterase
VAEVVAEDMKPDYLAPGPGRAAVLKAVMAMAQDLGPEVYVRQSRALQRRPDQQRTLRAVRAPTLILCGRHDGLTPVRRHELMESLIPGSRLEIIEDAGHLPTLEAPEATTDALLRWLGQAPQV